VKSQIVVDPKADRDLDEQFLYIAQDSREAAIGFLVAAQATFEQLAAMPELGELQHFRQPNLADVRVWRVRGFENYLIFYRPIERGVEIIRVLHGARDIPAILGGP